MTHCSECRRVIGPMLNGSGRPKLFRCPHTGRVAEMVDDYGRKIGETTDE